MNHMEGEVCIILFPPDKPQEGLSGGFEFSIRTSRPSASAVLKYMHGLQLHVSRRGVNISVPSAGAVQMLSEKKRIRAELGGGGGGGGGWGVNQPVTKTSSLNLRAPDVVRAAVRRGG